MEPPTAAAAADARPGGAWQSTLSCQELAAVTGVGFAQVGQVFGVAVYAADSASGSACPAARASAVGGTPAVSTPGGFEALVAAMYEARRTAIDRMTAQCAALDGHGVVAVRLSSDTFEFGRLEATVAGTAVRAPHSVPALEATRRADAGGPRFPFACAASGQDFARLIRTGWVPVGLALGIAMGARHDDLTTTRQVRPWARNAEVAGWTELVNGVRRDARRRMEQDVQRLGAEGVVTADMQMRVRQRDCPVAVGRHDHIVEVTFLGTAIAGFSTSNHPHAAAPLTIMPLGETCTGFVG
ncbi:MAG: heavy metal-binding domain-containing protein [Trebonia sp.]